MIKEPSDWYPGSFTKNFSWGRSSGLRRLHEAINICFDGDLAPVPRALAIERLESKGFVWHIPLNFFLLNEIVEGESHLVIDELVNQSLNFTHSKSFDKIAITAFNNSFVGSWKGAQDWQSRPAPWAYDYIRQVVATDGKWVADSISADKIERHIINSGRYRAEDARKLSTNLNFLYKIADLKELEEPKIERWWVDSLFLILDRSFAEKKAKFEPTTMQQLVIQSGFLEISGARHKNKDLAVAPLSTLYWACGGPARWSQQAVRERQETLLKNIGWFANSEDPFFAIYDHDPNVIKVIPRVCAMLAKNLADFQEIDADELIDWDPIAYIRRKTKDALDSLKAKGIRPNMSADDLLKITRSK